MRILPKHSLLKIEYLQENKFSYPTLRTSSSKGREGEGRLLNKNAVINCTLIHHSTLCPIYFYIKSTIMSLDLVRRFNLINVESRQADVVVVVIVMKVIVVGL